MEDDPGIRDIEIYALTSTGLEAQGFADGSAFWDALQKKQPELVLLDVMLPGVGGLELFTRLKTSYCVLLPTTVESARRYSLGRTKIPARHYYGKLIPSESGNFTSDKNLFKKRIDRAGDCVRPVCQCGVWLYLLAVDVARQKGSFPPDRKKYRTATVLPFGIVLLCESKEALNK